MRHSRHCISLLLASSLLSMALVMALAVAPAAAGAQAAPQVLAPTTPGRVHRLTLRNGSELVGKVLSVDSASVRFESDLGISTIALSAILSFKEEQPGYVYQGQYFYPNPNETRLVFAPTGRMLRQGEGYFTDFWIFFPAFAVGVTSRVTLGGGMSIFPGAGIDEQLLFFTPKVGIIRGPRFNAAVGALAMSIPEIFDGDGRTSSGILYGVGTWGSSDHSLTGGLGYGYVDDDLADRPVVMLGGETRLSPNFSLTTENYIFPGDVSLISGGIRFMSRRISVDLSFMRPTSTDESHFFPLLGFMYKW